MALPRERRLAAGDDIRRLLRLGRRVDHRLGRLHAAPRRDGGPTRLACQATRALGGAVVRNRARRRAQAAFAALLPSLPEGWELLWRVSPAVLLDDFPELCGGLAGLCRTAGVTREPNDERPHSGRAEQRGG